MYDTLSDQYQKGILEGVHGCIPHTPIPTFLLTYQSYEAEVQPRCNTAYTEITHKMSLF